MTVQALPLQLGPDANGMLITPAEFDGAECEAGWRYELIRGVLIVTPAPLEEERDPNEELGTCCDYIANSIRLESFGQNTSRA